MAIMQHLKSPAFTYDPNIDLQDNSQALADFLSQKKGFCQQFASLMAVMLRSIGIPARIGLGFTQGDPVANETGTYIVHGHDYHSWVEVPFEGYGWLTFDPTPRIRRTRRASATRSSPRRSNSALPRRATTAVAPRATGRGRTSQGPIHVGDVKAGITNGIQGGSQSTPRRALGGITLPNLVTIAGVLGVLLAIGIPLLHWLRRRRRLHTAHDPRGLILATYDVFTDRARELGVGRSPGETPEEFRRKLAGADKLDGAAASLTRMTTEVVRAAYAAEEPDADTAASVRHDADEVLHAMRAATPMRERVIGRYRSG